MYHIQFAWIMRLKFKPEPEPGQSEGSGSCQVPRLQAAPAPKPCVLVWNYPGMNPVLVWLWTLSWYDFEPCLGNCYDYEPCTFMKPVLVWALSWYENYEPFPSMSPVLVRTQSWCEPCPDLNPVLMWTLSWYEPCPDMNSVLDPVGTLCYLSSSPCYCMVKPASTRWTMTWSSPGSPSVSWTWSRTHRNSSSGQK